MSETEPSQGDLSPRRGGFRASVSNMMAGLARTFSYDSGPDTPTSSARTSQHNQYGYGGGGPASSYSSASSDPFELPPLEPIALRGYSSDTFSQPSDRLMWPAVAEEIRTLLPERLKLVSEWNLVYSLLQDGASLHTLYSRVRPYRGSRTGFVLVLQDSSRATFGAYLSECPRPHPTYFGNAECFLWRVTPLKDTELKRQSLPPRPSEDTTDLPARSTTLSVPSPDGTTTGENGAAKQQQPPGQQHIRFKAFPYSGVNDFIMNCDRDAFSIGGGGGHYGLRIDTSIEHGHSAKCETFGNEPLSDVGEKFYIVNAEVWAIGG